MAQKTFTSAVLTSSDVNTYLSHEGGAWTSYTPTLSQGASTNIGKTVTYSNYARAGRMITWNFKLDITGSGTSGQAVILTLPVTSVATHSVTGVGAYLDTGAGWYPGTIIGVSTTTIALIADPAGSFGAAPVMTVANTDTYQGSVTYEAAS
jgi:hypothetical protein